MAVSARAGASLSIAKYPKVCHSEAAVLNRRESKGLFCNSAVVAIQIGLCFAALHMSAAGHF